MPNHCANILRIEGPKDQLEAFRKFARGFGPKWDGELPSQKDELELDLNQFMPVPLKVASGRKNNKSDAFNSGGYEWVASNWGTKWGCYDITTAHMDNSLEYRFQTAWAPFSENVMAAMSKRFPELTFEMKYGECGMNFGGVYSASGGNVDTEYFETLSKKAKKDEDFQYCMENSG